ncbi:RHS repeat-associated core domain-containing protein [Kiritimatiellaeota bacterium B1221]|nr:RHS repeat-associated core domain-containing protein [Kiritimatiellaeota bacterium B1221]
MNSFEYIGRNEITSATMRNGNSTYTFDQIGNRVDAAVPAALSSPAGTFDYTSNALKQYTAINDGTTAPSPSYDLDGNMTHNGENLWFIWNAENRLATVLDYDPDPDNDPVTVTTPPDNSKRILFTYDSYGRRVRKVNETYNLNTDLWTPTSDLRYFYDGWNLLFEIDDIGTDPTRYYVWGLDLSQSMQGAGGVGGLLFTLSDGVAHAVSYDANGNISEYIDLDDGTVDAHMEYDAFGQTKVLIGTKPAAFGFSTKYQDTETGYYYYGFRYYDPETGRWPNRDPIEESGGYNLYGFVGNDAITRIDYLGNDWLDFTACFLGLSASELAGLRGNVSKELLTDPKIAKEVSEEIAKKKVAYGAAWKAAREKVIREVRKEATEKAIKKMGRKAFLKWLGQSAVSRAVPYIGQALLVWDGCKFVWCSPRFFR